MLTPKELYETYSNNPCAYSHDSPTYTQLDIRNDIYNQLAGNDMGAGTPMNWLRIVNFFKHVKYPCLECAPGYEDIEDTGIGKFSPTFKFLQEIDIEAYKEQQPTVRAGTSHAVRNCCDLSRACKLTVDNNLSAWKHRMATEYLEYFGSSSLPDCLMMCGPDLVHHLIAELYRAPGYTVTKSEEGSKDCSNIEADDTGLVYLYKAISEECGMNCFPTSSKGVAGGAHFCFVPNPNPSDAPPQCVSCDECPKDPVTGEIMDPCHPCCHKGTIFYYNECCNSRDKSNTRRDQYWSYWKKSDDGSFDGTISGGRLGEILRHVGILKRDIYHGYANFYTQCSGREPPIALDDMFLEYFQEVNDWDYTNNRLKDYDNTSARYEDKLIDRARTISMIIKATADNKANVTTDTDWMVKRVKDLLFNGYGVMLLSNVGFNNGRDSTGVSYPDRTFYHTYNIIGYDDTKVDYDECVYVLHLPFGEWNSGGHPTWGPLPTGSFLVTESHLKCLVNYWPTSDFYGCRQELCISTSLQDCSDPAVMRQYEGCGAPLEGRCNPYYCTKQQGSAGFLFAISLNKGFPKQKLNYSKYYAVQNVKDQLKPQLLYYKPED